MLMLLTNKNDSHADHFIRLAENRFPILRINTDDFFDEYEFQIYLTDTGITSGTIKDKFGRSHDLGNKTLAWYRKPQFDEMNVGHCGQYRDFIVGEMRAFCEILYTLPSIHWINHPLIAHSVRSKWQQLILAKDLGFNIPKTLIANNELAVRKFALKSKWPIITKSIYSASIEIEGMAMAAYAYRKNKRPFS